MEHDHLNKLSITFQQKDQYEIWWKLAKWFLKTHDFIQVNSIVAGEYNKYKQEAHGPRVAHLSDIATADMQMLCNIFPILSSQLMKRSSFKQFLILKKNIYGMPVNGAWSFEETLNGGQLGFYIRHDFSYFWSTSHPNADPTKFRVNWPFSSEEEAKNRFSRWLPWRPSWISDWHDFSYFSSTSHPNVS